MLQRFPEISFLLATSSFEPSAPKRRHNLKKVNLQDIEILYLVGLDSSYEPLKSWLHEKKERAVVFLEEDLGIIEAFKDDPMFADPQVHLVFLQKRSGFFDDLAARFPSEKIEVVAPKKPHLRLALMRKTTMIDAALTDLLYGHFLSENLIRNFPRAKKAFYVNQMKGCFKNIPAIICGAGPSLESSLGSLRTLENRALIMAGGSAITALSRAGIKPHFNIALDPNPLEFERLNGHLDDVPLIYSNRLNPDVLDSFEGPHGYLRSDTGGPLESWFENELHLFDEPIGPEIGEEGLAVTPLSVAVAHHFGCNPIILAGVDLAYTDLKSYTSGVVENPSLLLDVLRKEKKVSQRLIKKEGQYTLIKWIMEAKTLGSFAKRHPETNFINATSRGLTIPHIPRGTFECQTDYPLRAVIKRAIQENRMLFCDPETPLKKLQASFEAATQILSELALEKPDSGRAALLEIDLQEELAYQILLRIIKSAFELKMGRMSLEENAAWKWLERAASHISLQFVAQSANANA